QVTLLRLRRHARRRARALDVEDDERQLERDGQADRLLLQHDTRPARGGDPERAAERRAQRSTGSGNLVFGLERANAEVLVAGELLEDPRGRRDRVRTEKERQLRLDRRGDEPERERLVAGHVTVDAGRHLRRRDLVLDGEGLGRLPERVAGLQRAGFRLGVVLLLRKLLAKL